ncbi:uncharacterized protein LOC106867833 isoform X2 [Octopus bimaculoides]|uniref:LolA-like domain-containing protein n=1 Tax=Octopus bimaculoides TaxID=37653 RepID=A0A0L8HZL1_OCTBM|nr:uncharacterized protein LOC106867833 isoform X2 [Octopus bimaculoides]|eukprot:XP_014768348.1 PREDICTED: uncharacterized protein LOC106867833 isoform X2 [Octopus bimaculoides]
MLLRKISLLMQILFLTCCPNSSWGTPWNCTVTGLVRLLSFPLPEKYSVQVESKLINSSTINLLHEVYFQNISKLTVTNLTHVTHCLYDYNFNQLVTTVTDLKGTRIGSCSVNPLQKLSPCVPGHTETIPLFQISHHGTWVATDMAQVRQIISTHFELCLNYSSQEEIKLHAYIADSWTFPEIKPDVNNIVRVKFEEVDGIIVNDYVGFHTNPTYEDIQLPFGIFCENMKSHNISLPKIPNVFAMHYEKIFLEKITTEKLIFDMNKKYVLHEIENQNVSHGANIIIYDYYTGHKYTIIKATGQCQNVEKLQIGDRFVERFSSKLKMTDALSFFFLKKSTFEYIGMRQLRGVMCNVWTGYHFEKASNENITIEWYFTQKNWTDNIGETAERLVIFRVDVWMPGNPEAYVYNIYQFDTAPPSWSTFDITPCASYSDKVHFTIQFYVNNKNRTILRYLTDHSSVQQLQVALSNMSEITPVRIAHTEMDIDLDKKKLFFSASLLDAPKEENKQFRSGIKDNEIAYMMIQGLMMNRWNFSIEMKMNLKEKMIVNITAEKIWKSSADRIFSSTTKTLELSTTAYKATATSKPATSSVFKSTASHSTKHTLKSSTTHSTRPVHTTKHKTSNKPIITSFITSSVHSTTRRSSKASTKSSPSRNSVPSTKRTTSNTPKVSSVIHFTSSQTSTPSKTTFKTTLSNKKSTNKHFHTTSMTSKSSTKPSSTRKTKTKVPNFSTIRPMVCSCPTQPTSKPCTESLAQSSKDTISQSTLVGSIFGSFFLGIAVALILYAVRRIFINKIKGHHISSIDYPYTQF